ncbi:MAG TPA: hypothetical protein VEA60_12240, partial [Allosphingosinicella sp.]|nr:hypothetical protein [Allosphingosinicella sp.]
ATVYTTSARTTAHSNPVVADSGGLFANIFLDDDVRYRAILKTSGGTTIKDLDPYDPAGYPSALFTPEMFGAKGAPTDDTAALRAMVAAVNAAGRGHVRFMPGRTYLLGHDGTAQQRTLHFQGVDGLVVEAFGATLKTKDQGCPTVSNGYNWGQMTIDNCTDVQILGLTFDGNRAGQTHTIGGGFSYGQNFGLNFWTASAPHISREVAVRFCRFKDHGNLTSQTDILGDSIFALTGISRFFVEDNVFENWGRWAFALAEGGNPSSHVYFRRNTCIVNDRDDAPNGNYPWGAVDIEDFGLANSHLYIDDNVFIGTTQVALGGYGTTPAEFTVSDVSIRRNYWLLPDGPSGANVPFALGGSNPSGGVYRTLKRLFIEDNIVVWEGSARTTHVGFAAKLVDAFVRRNHFRATSETSTSDHGLVLGWGGHIEGRIEITDNRFIGLGEALYNYNWYSDPTPLELELRIERNSFESCYRAYNLQFNGLAAPTATSRIIFRGNRSENSRGPLAGGAGEYVDGGGIPTEYHDAIDADAIWAHLQLTYKGHSKELGPRTAAQLPAASAALAGVRGFVTDSNSTTFLAAVAGGGTNKVPVTCTGTQWIIG